MKEVVAKLNVTPRTVAFHKYHMMEELQLKTTTDLLDLAIKEGLVSQ